MSRITIDASDRTFLAVCECGWRKLTAARTQAEIQAEHHARAHHDDLSLASSFRGRTHRRAADRK